VQSKHHAWNPHRGEPSSRKRQSHDPKGIGAEAPRSGAHDVLLILPSKHWLVLSGIPSRCCVVSPPSTPLASRRPNFGRCRATAGRMLAVIKCIYLLPTYLHFIQDIEDMCLLLMSSTSFVDLLFQEYYMMGKHHMDQNPFISSICPK
jgi:hypothetical protein